MMMTMIMMIMNDNNGDNDDDYGVTYDVNLNFELSVCFLQFSINQQSYVMSMICPSLDIRNVRFQKVNKVDQKLFSLSVTELKLYRKEVSFSSSRLSYVAMRVPGM